MPEEVLFEEERTQHRRDVAEYLRTVADKLDAGEPITFLAGDRTVTLDPPARPTFEIKVEREAPRGADSGELSVEFELEWPEDAAGEDDLSIE